MNSRINSNALHVEWGQCAVQHGVGGALSCQLEEWNCEEMTVGTSRGKTIRRQRRRLRHVAAACGVGIVSSLILTTSPSAYCGFLGMQSSRLSSKSAQKRCSKGSSPSKRKKVAESPKDSSVNQDQQPMNVVKSSGHPTSTHAVNSRSYPVRNIFEVMTSRYLDPSPSRPVNRCIVTQQLPPATPMKHGGFSAAFVRDATPPTTSTEKVMDIHDPFADSSLNQDQQPMNVVKSSGHPTPVELSYDDAVKILYHVARWSDPRSTHAVTSQSPSTPNLFDATTSEHRRDISPSLPVNCCTEFQQPPPITPIVHGGSPEGHSEERSSMVLDVVYPCSQFQSTTCGTPNSPTLVNVSRTSSSSTTSPILIPICAVTDATNSPAATEDKGEHSSGNIQIFSFPNLPRLDEHIPLTPDPLLTRLLE